MLKIKNNLYVEIRENLLNNVKILDLNGEIDILSSMDLKKFIIDIIDSGFNKIILNFENILYIDSLGLGVIISALKKIKKTDGDLKLLNLSKDIKKIFLMTQIIKFFNVYDNEEDAILDFKPLKKELSF